MLFALADSVWQYLALHFWSECSVQYEPAGGGFSPFITPASTPRGGVISRTGSMASSEAGSTPRWSSSSYGPVAFGSPVSLKATGMSTPRTAAVSLLAGAAGIPAAIAGMPMVPALSPTASPMSRQASPAGVPPKPPPRRTVSGSEQAAEAPPGQAPGLPPQRSRSNLAQSPSQYQSPRYTVSSSPLSQGLRTPSRRTSEAL